MLHGPAEDSNFSLIDVDDVDELIDNFYQHYIRYQTEGIGKTAYMVYEHLGAVSFLRPEFIKRAKEKFESKKTHFEAIASKR